MGVRRFLRLLFDKDWRPPVPTLDNSLAKTAKDAIHVTRGGSGGPGWSGGFSGTSKIYDHIAEGHEDYAKSFEKEEG